MSQIPNHSHWLQTYSGKALDLLSPKSQQIDIYDIALGLSRTPRWSGQTTRFLSVAEHSVMVSEQAPKSLKMAALLHDAAEAYLGDLPAPVKRICPDYTLLEGKLMEAVCLKFNVLYADLERVCEFDKRVMAAEYRSLHPSRMFDPGPAADVRLEFWEPDIAYGRFIWHFDAVRGVF